MTKLVYLIKADNIYKIGVTTNLKSRLEAIERSIKKTVEIIHTFDGWTPQETDLHHFYKDKRIEGEWFNLTDEDVAKIKAITCYQDVLNDFWLPLYNEGKAGRQY